jgi:ABC-type transporter Mla subunit MlaD
VSAARRARDEPRVSPWIIGLTFLLVLAVLSVLAYTKKLPFAGDGYTLRATFENAATLTNKAPVRIAGVKVGEVTAIEPRGDAAEVTFTVDESGRPIHEDAEVEIRPRLFLEGNFFLDVNPGSPSAPELPEDGELSTAQTSTAVQLDQVLTSLQSDSRQNLRDLLEGYGTALTYEPTAADDRTHDPDTAGENAARSINDSFKYGGEAGRDSAIVNTALLGRGRHDLSRLIEGQRDVFTTLSTREAELQGLISNFNVFTGALAQEQTNLSATLRELAPTLEQAEPSLRHLSAALPPLRALAVELEPSIRELPGTIRAAGPWLDQTKKLLRDSELGGLAKQLSAIGPGLGRTTGEGSRLFAELTKLSHCATGVLDPLGETVITGDPGSALDDAINANGRPNFNEFLYTLVNQAGEGQSYDGNGSYLRLQAGGGPQLAQATNPQPSFRNNLLFGNTIEAPLGTQPRVDVNAKPPFRTDVNCSANPAPDLNGPAAAVAPPSPEAVP